MSHLIPILSETFLRLRRDRIFLPAVIAGILLLMFSGLASYWGVEEFFKILYDLGTTAYHLTGATVAIFWGIKIIHDSHQEGSIEVQLSSPVSRVEWLVAKYFGLACALLLLGLIFIVAWQLVYWGYGMGPLKLPIITIFAMLSLSWLVVGALAMLMASLSSYAIALFSSFWLFILGLLTAPLMQTMSPDTPESLRLILETMAGLWNLHYFNLYEIGVGTSELELGQLAAKLAYGLALITIFLGSGALVFQRKDLTS